MSKNKITVFVSSSFDIGFDLIFNRGIKPIEFNKQLNGLSIAFIRVDKTTIKRPFISDNVFTHIDLCDIFIGDITPINGCQNPNVMEELGYAKAHDIPIILIGKGNKVHEHLPANLKGEYVISYSDESESCLEKFSAELLTRLETLIKRMPVINPRGHFTAHGYINRDQIRLAEMIETATNSIKILTTNLDYTAEKLLPSIEKVLTMNLSVSFNIEILTLNPEAPMTHYRAEQLGVSSRLYREGLWSAIEKIKERLMPFQKVRLATYSILPTQIFFLIDDSLVLSTVMLRAQSRATQHLLIRGHEAIRDFDGHFNAVGSSKGNETILPLR